MPNYILALDQGTTSSRAILFDHDGRIVKTAQREFPQIYPQPGWVEHDPNDIWNSQLEVARQVVAGLQPGEIAAIGITNQRETTLVWDRTTGEPVYNAIVWQCRRTVPLCETLKAEGFDQVILAKTGLVTDAYFSGTKVAWILDNVPGARARAERGELAFGTVDSYLIWKLTGAHVTDVSNASRTLLYDIRTGDWSDEILLRLNIPRSLLPTVQPSSTIYGETTLLGGSIPIAGVAGDQQAATFGQVCTQPGMVKNTYGTGCFMLMNTGAQAIPSRNQLLTTVAWKLGDQPTQYALEGSVFIAGAAVQWLRDGLGLISSASESEALARSIPDTGGVYLVPAFVGLGAPYWDGFARGNISGLTRGSGKAHIVRAALESVAYQTRDVCDAMGADAGIPLTTLRVDGGMVKNDFVMQFQADILGVPVQRPQVTETTALGAAYLAGLAVGFWGSAEEIGRQWAVERTFEPTMSADQRESLYTGWKRAIERAKG
ncbi:MAG: glycerol kinase GlpK [Chloroflexi bacterium]|uniref:glycerol kinase GlpK n=1 Tax=Candidatus Flexifilum breve TaxID=3140694 RepID=UPI0031347A32|nr:glycerol kinase GlpK [Chloroflexota bacterium]